MKIKRFLMPKIFLLGNIIYLHQNARYRVSIWFYRSEAIFYNQSIASHTRAPRVRYHHIKRHFTF